MKLKRIVLALFATLSIIACKSDDDGFNHAAQAITDDEDIVDYLKTHYLDTTDDEIKDIDGSQTPLFDQMLEKKVLRNNIEYTLYYYVENEGVTISPTPVDSVLVNYKGSLLNGDVFEERKNDIWLTLNSVIAGWAHGLPNFKGGILQTNDDGTFDYVDNGKGIIVMPSGLGYGTSAGGLIPANSPLVFQVNLDDVNITDTDGDGLLSKFEDPNGDGEYDDDTDNDNFLNFLDGDDDNDGILTKYENADPNGDGNPSDAIDTDGDGIPNYLDPDDDNDGKETIRENADENRDGNPDDARDSDNDGTPDYLDNN
ncbi:FKBP-type peptidyl-prolyl cis-trans isomerase [Aureivirga marina]|uniref:FKBP-type peptidyl-prolyl cis-trans isomerase n=1 Tax=Aureivirga marina TaxID=1182451 RepID=UPI0018CA8D61|nr:FKBP-type peptidyl-prolyl cis-trans isomerase [Aureivirga marina]